MLYFQLEAFFQCGKETASEIRFSYLSRHYGDCIRRRKTMAKGTHEELDRVKRQLFEKWHEALDKAIEALKDLEPARGAKRDRTLLIRSLELLCGCYGGHLTVTERTSSKPYLLKTWRTTLQRSSRSNVINRTRQHLCTVLTKIKSPYPLWSGFFILCVIYTLYMHHS